MRLVSLCGYEARVISVIFDLGKRHSVVKEMELRERRSVKRQIHIGEYRDLSIVSQLLGLMGELIATPCGNAYEQQKVVVSEGHLKGALPINKQLQS